MRLRTRVAVGLAAVVLAFVVTGTVVAGNQRDYLTDQVDEQLRGATPFATRVGANREPTGASTTAPVKPPPDANGPGALSEIYVGRLSADGDLQLLVPSQFVTDSPDVSLDDARERATTPGRPSEPFTADGVDSSTRFRVVLVARPADSAGTVTGWEVIALPLTRADDAYGRLLLAFGVGAAAVLLIASLIAWWVLRLGVRPIVDMTEAAEAITAGDTERRVPTYPPSTEAGTLAIALNSMLDQHDADQRRLRQFVADASHELRTPLTSIRGYAELYERGGLDDRAMLDDAMRRVSGEAARMNELVEDLLLLSNLDRGTDLPTSRVDAAAVVRDAAIDARAVQPTRTIVVDDRPAIATADEQRLRQVVAGLVQNALVHTPADATIHLSSATVDAGGTRLVEIVVADTGPGLDQATAERVFERFFRGDASRSRHTGGSGLGLSIAESIVHAHGGTITLTTAPGEGCRFAVRLPAQPA